MKKIKTPTPLICEICGNILLSPDAISGYNEYSCIKHINGMNIRHYKLFINSNNKDIIYKSFILEDDFVLLYENPSNFHYLYSLNGNILKEKTKIRYNDINDLYNKIKKYMAII